MTKNYTKVDSSSFHIPSLDGWRAVAILMVFTSHIGLGHIIPGGLGVTIFFFLSGYLITTLLVREYDSTGTISISKFYIRRAFRLMPPLLITLAITYTLTYFGMTRGGISAEGFASQLLYFANYYYLFFDVGNSTPAGTGIFWSLAVEEHFYFIFPFLFAFFIHKRNFDGLKITLIALCATTLAWRYILVFIFESSANRTYYATDTRIDSIIFGCLLALIKNPLANKLNINSHLQWKDWGILGMSVAALVATLTVRDSVFRETLRYSIQGLALVSIFYYSIGNYKNTIFKPLNHFVLTKIGKLSYSIYLIHYFLIENLTISLNSFILKIILITVLALTYAILINELVDKPFAKIKRIFLDQKFKAIKD